MTDTDTTRASIGSEGATAFLQRLRAGPRAEAKAPSLTPEALAVAATPAAAPMSPIVLAGFVRMAEFALIVLVGIAVFALYLSARRRSDLALRRRDLRHRPAVDVRLPDRRYLPGAGLPRSREAIHAAGLGLVGRVPDRDRRFVLRQSRRDVLARLARQLLRQRPGGADDVAAAIVSAGAQMDARRPPHPPHRDRRRRRARRTRHRRTAAAKGFRRQDHRPVRRPRRRSQQHGLRRRAQTRRGRRPGRVRPPHARRSGDLFAADFSRRPHSADAEEIVGAAGRHPARRPHQQTAIPPALLFLHRQRAGARRLRSADRRLGRRDEMAVRQIDRRHHARSARCR